MNRESVSTLEQAEGPGREPEAQSMEEEKEEESQEGHEARSVSRPREPTEEEICKHCDSDHIPYRNWCRHCVYGQAVNQPHP